ncbi:5188_t:CDS:2 [Cetraspora pellucida]|uniref:5188_t:CDS:1 n=1 Tax=Cetraspora pellucida TaxID=1433469 RepID=A0A9N9IH94_9GLOM|nr:5188_t:CDS:2 [Cetraspora pellucida]
MYSSVGNNNSQDEIVKELCDLYNNERMKGKFTDLIFDTMDQFLVKEDQRSNVLIKLLSNNQINPVIRDDGLRPNFALSTPGCYIELGTKCMDSDPQKRPNINDVKLAINNWIDQINSDNDNKIKKQFLDSDVYNSLFPITLQKKHPDHVYTSEIRTLLKME